MRVFCVACGAANEGEPGARMVCSACAVPFDIPPDVAEDGSRPSAAATRTFEAPPVVEPMVPTLGTPLQGATQPAVLSGKKTHVGKVTNGWAVASLIFGIVCCIPVVSPAAGIICGLIALSQLSADPEQTGQGMAMSGIVLSLITAGVSIYLVASGTW